MRTKDISNQTVYTAGRYTIARSEAKRYDYDENRTYGRTMVWYDVTLNEDIVESFKTLRDAKAYVKENNEEGENTMNNKQFDTLRKNEIKKVLSYVMKRDGAAAHVTAWWTEDRTECDMITGFQTIGCEILSDDYTTRHNDVYIAVCLWDRRRSFVVEGTEGYLVHEGGNAVEGQETRENACSNNNEYYEEENTMTTSKTMNKDQYHEMFTADCDKARETVRAWRDAVKALDEIQSEDRFTDETPEHTVKAFVDRVGFELAQFVVASLVNRSAWDGRIDQKVSTWAEGVEGSLDEEAALEAAIWSTMHTCHLNQVARAMMDYKPEEAEKEENTISATTESKALTYDEFMELAKKHYCHGGGGFYECWEDYQFSDYVEMFGQITKERALKMFADAFEIDEEYKKATAYFSGESHAAQEHDEPAAKEIVEAVAEKVEQTKTRSAWDRGVKEYAKELVEELRENVEGGYIDTDALCDRGLFEKAMLNGASNWRQYSEGGCSLCYDGQIAARLCAPWELRKTDNGRKEPNSRESWIDVQSRALYQAAQLVLGAAF